MANKQRGEATLKGPGGKNFTLCLTLGAVAQIEEELGVDSLTEIDGVFEKARMRDVITILVALLQGGGHTEITRESMMAWPMDMKSMMEGIRDAFTNAGFGEPDGDAPVEGEDPNPPAGKD